MRKIKNTFTITIPLLITYLTMIFVDSKDIIENFFKLNISMEAIFISLLVGAYVYLYLKVMKLNSHNRVLENSLIEKYNELFFGLISIKYILNLRLSTPKITPALSESGVKKMNEILEVEKNNVKDFLLQNYPKMTPEYADKIVNTYHVDINKIVEDPFS